MTRATAVVTGGTEFVVAAAQGHAISDFVATAFAAAGISDWQQWVISDDSLIRPADRPDVVGDATKAWEFLGWKPMRPFHEIVVAMVDSDLTQERDA